MNALVNETNEDVTVAVTLSRDDKRVTIFTDEEVEVHRVTMDDEDEL